MFYLLSASPSTSCLMSISIASDSLSQLQDANMQQDKSTWWFIPLSKFIPFMTRVATHLLCGMSHQVPKSIYTNWIWDDMAMVQSAELAKIGQFFSIRSIPISCTTAIVLWRERTLYDSFPVKCLYILFTMFPHFC